MKTVEEVGKLPETEITIQEIAVEDESGLAGKPLSETKKPKKKVIKKTKVDEQDDYIQRLIEMDIPKTELEQFEKPEFQDLSSKTKKSTIKPNEKKVSFEDDVYDKSEEAIKEVTQDEIPVESGSDELIPIDLLEDNKVIEEENKKSPKKLMKKKLKDMPKLEPTDEVPVLSEEAEGMVDSLVAVEQPEKLQREEGISEDIPEEASIIVHPNSVESDVVSETNVEEKSPENVVTNIAESDLHNPQEEDQKATVKKNKIKSKKQKPDSTEDDYIKKLLDQEIPKTELEKFEKIDFDKPTKKSKPKKTDLIPHPIERKDQKPQKIEIVSVEELPIKLKPKKPKLIEKPEEEKALAKPRLKSRITYVDIENPLSIKLSVLGAVRDQGELSRNIEEAEKLLKTKPKKFKHIEKRKDSLERPELEKYEKYESSSDESESSNKPYQRQKKDAPKDEIDEKTLKLGKGKPRPEDEVPEIVKLKSVPHKETPEEEIFEPKPKKIGEKKTGARDEEEDKTYKLKPLNTFDFESEDIPREELEKIEMDNEPKPKKPKDKKRPKVDIKQPPIPETIQHPIIPGNLFYLFIYENITYLINYLFHF